jgi:hypothetical protein
MPTTSQSGTPESPTALGDDRSQIQQPSPFTSPGLSNSPGLLQNNAPIAIMGDEHSLRRGSNSGFLAVNTLEGRLQNEAVNAAPRSMLGMRKGPQNPPGRDSIRGGMPGATGSASKLPTIQAESHRENSSYNRPPANLFAAVGSEVANSDRSHNRPLDLSHVTNEDVRTEDDGLDGEASDDERFLADLNAEHASKQV